jgi:hypothetical protein
MEGPTHADQIAELAEAARVEREVFDPPRSLPDRERATGYLREGFGPAVALYLDAHTGEGGAHFSEVELSLLERAINDWLALYLQCHGAGRDPDVTVREAAEVLVETRDIRDTARRLTGVPPRERNTHD